MTRKSMFLTCRAREGIRVASRSAGSRAVRDQTCRRSRSPTETRACCGRYSPKVRVIDQRRLPPASPKFVEGPRAETGYHQPEIAQVVSAMMANRADRHLPNLS